MTDQRPDNEELRKRHVRNLELFVMRARRVQAHSLSELERLENLRQGSMTLAVSEVEQVVIIDLPPEEQMESLAARVRPTILDEEDTHWGKVLEAIGYLAPNANARAKEVRKNLKNGWKEINDKATGIRGYGMLLKDEHGANHTTTDNLLAWAWFYGDVVHANAERLAKTAGFSVFDRYRAATSLVADIAVLTLATLHLIESLQQEGHLALDPDAFTTEVVVTETRRERKAVMHMAPIGTPMPEDVDTPLGPDWTTFDGTTPSQEP